MKKTILFFVFLFGIPGASILIQSNQLLGQEICNDTIFPLKTKKIITECCIDMVKDDNFVMYTKGGEHFGVEAKAIIKDGLYVPLAVPQKQATQIQNQTVTPKVQPSNRYKYNYEKYAKRYKNAKIISTVGVFMSITGIAMVIGANASYNNRNMTYNEATTLATIGFIAFNFGVPTSIIGLAMSKNSKKAMIHAKQQILDLSLGVSQNGVGLILKL